MNHVFDTDSHNGGRKCFVKDRYVYKPRSLFAEEKLFSCLSPLRKYLDQLFEGRLTTLPYLEFENVQGRPSLDYQKMSFLELESISRPLTDIEIESIGATFALLNLLGVSDMHKTNILFGEKEGRVYFAPIDLEIIFQSFLFSALSFLPSDESHAMCCSGSYHFYNYKLNFDDSDFTAKLIDSYAKSLSLIMQHKVEIYRLMLLGYDPEQLPIRVVLRPTGEYHSALQSKKFSPYSIEEREQLERGDIPYFFKFVANDNKIYYWKNDEEFVSMHSNNNRDIPIYTQTELNFLESLQSFCLITSCLDSDLGNTSYINRVDDTQILHKQKNKFVLTPYGSFSVPRYLFKT